MSAALYSASGNNATVQSTTVGGSKPLHRFLKGQPKTTGVVVLILGLSFVIVSIVRMEDSSMQHFPYGLIMGTLFITCGILYILTEHSTTKKTVTISLALTIVTILGSCWSFLHILPDLSFRHYYRHDMYDYYDNETQTSDELWKSHYWAMENSVDAVFLFYSFGGAIILIVMSVLAGTALRSSNSQTIVVMTTVPTETPA